MKYRIEPRFTTKMLPLSARIHARLGAKDHSSMGADYETAMRRMLIAGIDYINQHPDCVPVFKEYNHIFGHIDDLNSDAQKLYNVVLAAEPNCSSAQMQEIMGYLTYIVQLGWEKFVEMMEWKFTIGE